LASIEASLKFQSITGRHVIALLIGRNFQLWKIQSE